MSLLSVSTPPLMPHSGSTLSSVNRLSFFVPGPSSSFLPLISKHATKDRYVCIYMYVCDGDDDDDDDDD